MKVYIVIALDDNNEMSDHGVFYKKETAILAAHEMLNHEASYCGIDPPYTIAEYPDEYEDASAVCLHASYADSPSVSTVFASAKVREMEIQ